MSNKTETLPFHSNCCFIEKLSSEWLKTSSTLASSAGLQDSSFCHRGNLFPVYFVSQLLNYGHHAPLLSISLKMITKVNELISFLVRLLLWGTLEQISTQNLKDRISTPPGFSYCNKSANQLKFLLKQRLQDIVSNHLESPQVKV